MAKPSNLLPKVQDDSEPEIMSHLKLYEVDGNKLTIQFGKHCTCELEQRNQLVRAELIRLNFIDPVAEPKQSDLPPGFDDSLPF